MTIELSLDSCGVNIYSKGNCLTKIRGQRCAAKWDTTKWQIFVDRLRDVVAMFEMHFAPCGCSAVAGLHWLEAELCCCKKPTGLDA